MIYSFERHVPQQGWYRARVKQALDEIIRVQTTLPGGATADCWVELESSKLAWPGTYTSSDKSENFLYFRELYKMIEPFGKEMQASG